MHDVEGSKNGMSPPAAETLLKNHEAFAKRHLKRNFSLTVLDGAAYMAGFAFVDVNVVLPRIVDSMHGPIWLIALLPLLDFVSVAFWQFFFTARIEKLPTMKPFVLFMGTLQRTVYLLTGLIILIFAHRYPWLILVAVAATPVVAGFFIGSHVSAWQELVAKSIPTSKMPAMWAIRSLLGALLGIGSGTVVSIILERITDSSGYGMLYCIAFGFYMLSIVFISLIKEPPLPPKKTDAAYGMRDFMQTIVPIIRSDARLRMYLFVRIFSTGITIVAPFLGLRALEVLKWPDSSLGTFISAQMCGAILGYILGGLLGNHKGPKPVIQFFHLFAIVLSVWVAFAHQPFEFIAIFTLFGLAGALNLVGTMSLGYQLCPVNNRIAYLATMSFATIPGMLLAWGLATFGKMISPDMTLLSICAVVMMLISLFCVSRLDVPPPVRASAG